MPPKAGNNSAGKTYSADVVAAVLYATGTISLSMKHYELMSSLDGTKTASAFQHDFRAVLAKARELKARTEKGEVFEAVQPTTKRVNMAKAADPSAGAQKTLSADCVAILLMALDRPSISREQLSMMSALDGTRTASSFEHQFRSIVAKAKELKKRVADGETFAPVTAEKRGTNTPVTPLKRKGIDTNDIPTKKTKTTPKPRGKKTQPQPSSGSTPQATSDEDELPADMEDFIKSEKNWEEQFI